MNNMMTNQLRTAEMRTISTFWPIGQKLKPAIDRHQIIFRSGTYFGKVLAGRSLSQQLRVLDRDIVVSVYTQPRLHRMAGTVRTRDKYRRIYDVDLIIEATDPIKVASAYIHEKDPVGQALNIIKRVFEQEATNYNHDYIPFHNWPFEAWSIRFFAETGIRIKQHEKFMFREDPVYTERAQALAEARLQAEKTHLEQEMKEEQELYTRAIEAASKEAERKEKENQSNFERSEKTKDQLYQICYDLREVAAKEIKTALQDRIQESFACGHTPSQISGEYFALLSIFQDKMHITFDRWIAAGLYVEGDLDYEAAAQEELEEDSGEEEAVPEKSTN